MQNGSKKEVAQAKFYASTDGGKTNTAPCALSRDFSLVISAL
jgi:hypothetical protein